jgi:uncharacterized membrane protein (DUF485 family)
MTVHQFICDGWYFIITLLTRLYVTVGILTQFTRLYVTVDILTQLTRLYVTVGILLTCGMFGFRFIMTR